MNYLNRIRENISPNVIYLLLLIYSIIAVLIILFFDGTGDAGDSIHHYLFAKYAPQHPQLFFDHWAKPVYVLLSCPFAQFGFNGIKAFNVLVSILTIFFTYRATQELGISNTIMVAVILIFSPLYFVLTFSGLTEPLFALFISLGLYFIMRRNNIAACIVVSFLPFIRSEGLIILAVFGFYFLIRKEWKLLPCLLLGHAVYSVAGFFVYGDLFWVFNKIPYAELSVKYGSGKPTHFIEQLIYVLGVPVFILFWMGMMAIVWKALKKSISQELLILVFLGFTSFFIAHSLFWYLGIFNSMGLKRVLIAVMPFIAIISLTGFNFLLEDVLKNKRTPVFVIRTLLIAYILIFPFTANPAAIGWETDMKLSADQRCARQVIDFLIKSDQSSQRLIFAHPYLSEALNIDHFDENRRLELTQGFMNQARSGDIIIWENWFAVVEHGLKKDVLDKNSDLMNIYNAQAVDKRREVFYSVYRRK